MTEELDEEYEAGTDRFIEAIESFNSEFHWVNDRHPQYVGWVAGKALRHGLDVTIVVDVHGNYTDRLIIPIGRHRIIFVVPPPPDDWTYPNA